MGSVVDMFKNTIKIPLNSECLKAYVNVCVCVYMHILNIYIYILKIYIHTHTS